MEQMYSELQKRGLLMEEHLLFLKIAKEWSGVYKM